MYVIPRDKYAEKAGIKMIFIYGCFRGINDTLGLIPSEKCISLYPTPYNDTYAI